MGRVSRYGMFAGALLSLYSIAPAYTDDVTAKPQIEDLKPRKQEYSKTGERLEIKVEAKYGPVTFIRSESKSEKEKEVCMSIKLDGSIGPIGQEVGIDYERGKCVTYSVDQTRGTPDYVFGGGALKDVVGEAGKNPKDQRVSPREVKAVEPAKLPDRKTWEQLKGEMEKSRQNNSGSGRTAGDSNVRLNEGCYRDNEGREICLSDKSDKGGDSKSCSKDPFWCK